MGTIPPTARVNQIRYAPRRHGQEIRQSASRTATVGEWGSFSATWGRAISLSPQELLEKLAALVPPPRLNLVRYHGVLAPNANDRAHIVPGPKVQDQATDSPGNDGTSPPAQRRHRLSWAVLLARVFDFELSCM